MNNLRFFSAILVLAVLAGTTPALALSFGASSNADISITKPGNQAGAAANAEVRAQGGRDDGDQRREASMQHWKSWSFNAGIAGTVTAAVGDTVTVDAKNGTTYDVDISDAQVRGSAPERGDRVYVQGVVNGDDIVATLLINGKAADAKPSDDDRRAAVVGTVTAKSDTTLTVLAKNGTTYTVAAADASVWVRGEQDDSLSRISVGDSVVVQGRTDGDTVTASKIIAVAFPALAADGGIRGTVTAVNGDTFTLMVAGGMTYTVDADSASFEDRKGRDQERADIETGDMVIVTGEVSGSTIDAEVVTETKLNRGFFYRIGNFLKSIFGGSVEGDAEVRGSAS